MSKALTHDRVFSTQQSLNRAIKNVCDILRRSNCAGALQYIPELTWILFLRILDEQETLQATQSKEFNWSVPSPYRWQDWAAPFKPSLFRDSARAQPAGWMRHELENKGDGSLLEFINRELFPYLTHLGDHPQATARQKIIGEVIGNIERTRIDTEYNLLDVLNQIHQIRLTDIDPTHIFPLSQVYEGLLLKMGQKSNDGGQFFTPREVVRTMVRAVAPQPGETIYDPCCGTGGFLAQTYAYINPNQDTASAMPHLPPLKNENYYGCEKENLIYPLALANLVLHGIDEPHLWHGNTLTGQETYGGLFAGAPQQFDVILTNPPFGGKESKLAQAQFDYKSSSTQLLFLQHVIDHLNPGGRCGIVVDEGVLFRTNDAAFARTKRRLLTTCDLWCILSLPLGAFSNAGASIKTDILFFTKGRPTEKIWYYDLSDVKTSKAAPLTSEPFEEFLRLLPHRVDSEKSWSVTRQQIEENGYDLKAVNPRQITSQEQRSLKEILSQMEKQNQEIQDDLQSLGVSTHGRES